MTQDQHAHGNVERRPEEAHNVAQTTSPEKMALFLKISPGGFSNASRNKRELSVVRDLGMETLVVTKGQRREATLIDGWPVLKLSTRPLGPHPLLVQVNRAVSLLSWAREVRRLNPTIISGHDLIGTLVAWISTLCVTRRRRPLLVYDSHEFELGRNTGGRRGRVGLWWVGRLESFLMRRCVFSIMVNDAIATRVQEIHGLAEKPIVVRSTPPLWTVDEQECAARRADFCRELGVPAETFLMMYHGGVVPNRGVEMSIRVLVGRDSVALVVLGNGDPGYLERLRSLARDLGVESRVLFREAVPLEDLVAFVGAVDVGMVLVPPVVESYYLMLPNKLFENVQSLTPVIASNFPEIGLLVRQYDIGLLVDPEDESQVGAAVDQLRSDAALCSRLRDNLGRAKTDLCWEKEREVLVAAYKNAMESF